MIILDTNVVSEVIKAEPNVAVKTWINEQAAEKLYLSSVTLAELLRGIAVMPVGKRKNRLRDSLVKVMSLFKGRVLPFDNDAAYKYADLAVVARTTGRGFPLPDGYIAAIAASQHYLVASRDIGLYEAVNVDVVNPWEWKR